MSVLAERRGRRITDAGVPANQGYPESYWRSLQYFNIYRLLIALLLLGGVLFTDGAFQLGAQDRALFIDVALLYLLFGFACLAVIRTRWRFNVQMAVQVVLDIVFLTVLIYASRGVGSGVGLLLLTTLAGAGLISRGRLALFFAALASIAVLLEHGYEVLAFQESATHFIQVGFLAIGYFATALVAHTLAQLTRQNEEIAAQRASDVANLSEVNRLVIQDMPDGVVVVDGEGVIRQVNTQAEAFLGSLRGQQDVPLTDYAPALAAHLARWRADAAGATGTFPGNAVAENARYGLRFVAVGVQPAAGAVVFLEDLSRVRDQAQQMKLAAIGRLTANIAHEIRNPLGSISHAAQLLQEEPEASPGMRRLLGIIHDNTQRLNRMVNDVLGLNRGHAAAPETIRVGEFVRQFVTEFTETEQTSPHVIAVHAADTLMVQFDRTHLNQVLWNLCRNALRHCRGGAGSVQIRARRARGGRDVKLDVIDDGPGVPPSVRSGLFEPFMSRAPGGTGLGLYIARELCVANGAELDHVERGAGAQFTLTCRTGA